MCLATQIKSGSSIWKLLFKKGVRNSRQIPRSKPIAIIGSGSRHFPLGMLQFLNSKLCFLIIRQKEYIRSKKKIKGKRFLEAVIEFYSYRARKANSHFLQYCLLNEPAEVHITNTIRHMPSVDVSSRDLRQTPPSLFFRTPVSDLRNSFKPLTYPPCSTVFLYLVPVQAGPLQQPVSGQPYLLDKRFVRQSE